MPLTKYTLGDITTTSRMPWGQIHTAVQSRQRGESLMDSVLASGITRTTLSRIFFRLGLNDSPPRALQRRLSRESGKDYGALNAEAVRLYCDEGCSSTEVARLIGLGNDAVLRAVRKAGRRVRSYAEARCLLNQQRAARGEMPVGMAEQYGTRAA